MTLQKPTLYLHIGTHKTGTSSIQMALHTHREELLKAGVLYPALNNAYNHYELAVLLKSPEGMTIIQNWFDGIVEKVNQRSINKVVISAEALYFLRFIELVKTKDNPRNSTITEENYREKLNNLRALIPDIFDIKVVVYLRRQDSFIQSGYSQLIKGSEYFSGSIREFIDGLAVFMDYSFMLNLWAEIFGKENILVRVYEKQQLPGGSVQDFLRVIEIPTDLSNIILSTTDNYNIRLSRELLDYKLILNQLLKNEDPVRKDQLHYTLLEKLSEQPEFRQTNGEFLTTQEKRDIISRYSESNAKVAREFLGREDGRLFYEALPEETKSDSYPGLSVERAVEIGTRLSFLVIDGYEQRTKIKSLHSVLSYPELLDAQGLLNMFPMKILKKIYVKIKNEKDIRIIRRSGLFDAEYYLAYNPDVAASGVEPIRHFAYSGWKELRKPNDLFDVNGYILDHPEIIRSGMNPLVHKIIHSKVER